jgi:hypothetical protein
MSAAASRNPPMSEVVADAHVFAPLAAGDGEAHRIEARRAEAERGIARKADPLARDAGKGVEPAIVVFVVDEGDAPVAGGQAGKLGLRCAGGDVALDDQPGLAAARKALRVAGQADAQRAPGRAQPVNAEVDRARRARPRQRRQRRERQDEPGGRSRPAPCPSRKAGPRSGNKGHNYTCTAHGGAGDGSP